MLCLPWLTGLLWGSNDVMGQGARWHLLCTRQTKRISIYIHNSCPYAILGQWWNIKSELSQLVLTHQVLLLLLVINSAINRKLTPEVLSPYCQAMQSRNTGKRRSNNFRGSIWTHTNSNMTPLPCPTYPFSFTLLCLFAVPPTCPSHSSTITPHSKYKALINVFQLSF